MQTPQTKTLISNRPIADLFLKTAFFSCETVKPLNPSIFNNLIPKIPQDHRACKSVFLKRIPQPIQIQ
jgi:hypothetical protein